MKKIDNFINNKYKNTKISIKETTLKNGDFWFYENGIIKNTNGSFFKICGIANMHNAKMIASQPIIIQDEIGYIGVIATFIDKKIYFLLQAKIEPGNLNYIQLSPTLQATYSNFKQKHGGNKPKFLDNFLHPKKVLVDVLQSEQGSRFFKKRNRNIVILEEYFDAPEDFIWLSFDEINKILTLPNVVNMDARTVLSQMFFTYLIKPKSSENSKKALFSLNNCKMFNEFKTKFCRLDELENWQISNKGIFCKNSYPFCVKFYEIFVEGRENPNWKQPLFVANDKAIFALFISKDNGFIEVFVNIKAEIGSFDIAEFSPSIWLDSIDCAKTQNEKLFVDLWQNKKGVVYENLLSEEGGRFYHEENFNVIIEINKTDIDDKDGFWLNLNELSYMMRHSHYLNIQLRNLLLLLFRDIDENWDFRNI